MLAKLESLSAHLKKVAALEVASPAPPKVEMRKTATVQLDTKHIINFVKFFAS